jgi:hypothetical protein
MTESHSNQEGIVRKAMNWAAKLSLAFVAFIALGLTANMAHAVSINLATLITNNGSITEGDKTFSNFSLTVNGTGTNFGPTDGSGITVNSFTLDTLHHGLQFAGGLFAGANSSADFLIGYTVTTTNNAPLINDIQLSFNGAVTGTGQTLVTETAFLPGTTTVIGQIQVNNPPAVFNASIDLVGGPYASVRVVKDILLVGGTNGFAGISFVDQVVSQVAVPEPTSVLLLGSGLAAFGVWGMKRRKSA